MPAHFIDDDTELEMLSTVGYPRGLVPGPLRILMSADVQVCIYKIAYASSPVVSWSLIIASGV